MDQQRKHRISLARVPAIAAVVAVVVFAAALTTLLRPANAGSSVTLAISQIPLIISTPSHPQVLIAIGNSQSLDGTLSGAIMAGSGTLSSGLTSLNNSSSPATYAVPAGFSPPVQAADGMGNAPYTVSQGGNLVDNGASRLNVAKGGVQAIIQAYMQNTDFALETYAVPVPSVYTTWVYYMSPASSGFVFTNTQTAGNRYVANPCFNYATASSTVNADCSAIDGSGLYGASPSIGSKAYMQIGASSDDPLINDVLYDYGQPGVTIVYGGPNYPTPYPPNYSLGQYNSGGVTMSYPYSVPGTNATSTGPTNAGYVPYSNQVMYAERGFGYYAGQSANSGNVIVRMQTAGTAPTASSVSTAVNAFLPALAPETNNGNTTEIKAQAVQGPTAGLLAGAQNYLSSVVSQVHGCTQKQYVVLISDGLPTEDLSGNSWPPLGSAAALGYGVTATFNADGSLNTTNDQALTDTITNLTNLRNAGVVTYVVGLGAGVDSTVNPQAAATLTAMAIAGGNPAFYPASSPTALVTDLNNILVSIQSGIQSTAAPTSNSPFLDTHTVRYQTSFNPNDTPYQDWTGDLYEQALDPITAAPTGPHLWSAQALLDSEVANGGTNNGWSTKRVIASWNPALNSGSGGGAPFEWTNLSITQQGSLQPSDTLGQSRLQYLRGNSAMEKRNGGTFRNRSHILGDMVDSQPILVGAPSAPYLSASYVTFMQTQATRQPMVYAGANDGMLHAFNATTGAEQFSFVPNAVFANLQALTGPLYNQNHLFFVDGSPQMGDVQFTDATWHTVLVGGEAAGGTSIYAIDVTNPQSLNTEATVASSVLWEFSDTDMGLSYSAPQIAPIAAAPTFAVFFGNGYNSQNNKAILYAVNPQTGQTISKIDLCAAVTGACNSALPQGLSSVAIGNSDGLPGQPITQIYAGDLQGNLWAIDVSNSNVALWQVRLLFQARDAGGNIQSITTPPQVTLQPNFPRLLGNFIMFSTGQLLTVADLSNPQIQTVYGIWDKPGNTTVPTRSNLQSQTLTSVSLTQLTATANTVNWTNQLGWYDDLPLAGQRTITAPVLQYGAFVATLNMPPLNTCGNWGEALDLNVNYSTGGFIPSQFGGAYSTNTVAVGVGVGYGTSSAIVCNNAGCYEIINLSNGTTVVIPVPNNTRGRIAWWQIQ